MRAGRCQAPTCIFSNFELSASIMVSVKPRISSQDPRTDLVVLGFTAGVGQALLLREAMAATGGSELAWGTVMALWLAGMAGGSRLGIRLGGGSAAPTLPLITILLVAAGVMLLRAAPALLGTAPGETISTWHATWLWAAAVVPPACAGGLAFPIFTGRLASGGAGTAYGLEALGAIVGGLALSFAIATLGTAAALCLTAMVAAPFALRSNHRILAWIAVLGLGLAAGFAGNTLAAASWRWAGHPGTLSRWVETRQQRLELAAGPPHVLYTDGRLAASYPDPFSTVPAAHLVMLLHPDPEGVVAVGCLADGSIATMARHPASRLVVVEDDPRLAEVLPGWYGGELRQILEDPRIELRTTDPIRALSRPGRWDLIVLRDGNPITIRQNRTRTVEFFSLCRDRMADDGILIVRLQLSDTYLGGSAGRLLEVMVATLREVFAQVVAVPGEQVLLVAGGPAAEITTDPGTLIERWRDRGVVDSAFAPEMLNLLVDTGRAADLETVVARSDAPMNTRKHPRAVLLAAGMAEARARPFLLGMSRSLESRPPTLLAVVLVLLIACLLGTALRPRPAPVAIAMVVGACSMGWWLLLLAVWQSTRGSVYAEVGALSAAFMAGLATGSLIGSRWKRPSRRLPWICLTGSLVSLILASSAALDFPVLVVPTLLAVGGLLTGAAFPGLADLSGGSETRAGAGIAFAADEGGAAAAALVIGVLVLPWAGMAATAIGLALLQLAVLPSVIRAARQPH